MLIHSYAGITSTSRLGRLPLNETSEILLVFADTDEELAKRKCCNYVRRYRLTVCEASWHLANAQQCAKYPGLPRQVLPSYSQDLAFANHVYRFDPLNYTPTCGCASRPLHRP